ncbi:MAG: radical protein [Bacteroidetes bacterium]|nr:radical protein [Bacteroidota bacterium]
MINIYKFQKLNKIIKSRAVRNISAWGFHTLGRRYIALYYDPVLACNLRCRSCFFSNEEKRKELKGVEDVSNLPQLADALFGRVMRLQIGCAAEPTLYKHNTDIILLARKHGVQYISMTTNANLLTPGSVAAYLEAGLSEITISVHGVRRETYEYLMVNASFDKLIESLGYITESKKRFPAFRLRINYTINHINVAELSGFFETFGRFSIDILQLRALHDIGGQISKADTSDGFYTTLQASLDKVASECSKRKIIYIEPDDFNEDESEVKYDNPYYLYSSPAPVQGDAFDWKKESYNAYCKRTGYIRHLLTNTFRK